MVILTLSVSRHLVQGDKTVKLLMQLKLNEAVKNNFEYCEVQMPFFHRYGN